MPKPVAEVGEGHEDASGNGVYCFIRDLIVEGRDARFVDKKGRYVINWSSALKCYHDYKSKRNPQYKSKNISRRKASNGLRAALLNFYKKEGAKEYKDCKKVNKNDEVVERQFQMPPRVFESLFGSNEQLSDDSSEHETSSITSEADEKPLTTPNSSDTGFDEAMDISDDCALGGLPVGDPLCSNVKTEEEQVDPSDITTPCQMFGISGEDLDSVIGEICSNSDANDMDPRGVVHDICPSSGSVKGGMQFVITLTEELSEDENSGIAHFDGIGDVYLDRLNCYTLAGTIPASQQPGTVPVTVNTQDGHLLGITCFTYVDDILELLKQVVKDPALQSLYLTMWCQEYGLFGNDGSLDSFNLQGQGSSVQGTHAQALKGLQLLVYTAAQTNAQQFIQMIFSTSAGRLVFNAYKNRPQLPEDVARANGHDDLAQYLQDVNVRLAKENSNDVQPSSIDWLELIKAVNKIQKQSSVIEDETDVEVGQSKDDDDLSDYFADVETSSCGSVELEIGWSDSEDGEGPCSEGGGSDKEPDVKSASSMNVMPCKAYTCAEVETHLDNDLDLEDDKNSEEGEVKEVCDMFGQQIGVATQKRENTSEREQEARAFLDQEKCMQLKSPFTKDERPKKEPDERLTPSMEGTSSEAPTVLGTNLDNEVDQKEDGKNDRNLGTTEVGKSSMISQLSKNVAKKRQSGREEETSTVPSQEKTTKPKRTTKWLKGDAVTTSSQQGACVNETQEVPSLRELIFQRVTGGGTQNRENIDERKEDSTTGPSQAKRHKQRTQWRPFGRSLWGSFFLLIIVLIMVLCLVAGIKLREGQLLHWAVRNGHIRISQVLLKFVSDVDAPHFRGETPLHLAAKNGYTDLAELLMKLGSNVNSEDYQQRTPLHLAAWSGCQEIANALVRHGSDVNAGDDSHQTPLHLAAWSGCQEIANALVRHGSDVNAGDDSHQTPLHLAARIRCQGMANALIRYGSDVNAGDDSQQTPLHLAARSGCEEIANDLIRHGSDLKTRDDSLRTALHLAALNGHRNVLQVLIQSGSDVNTKERFGWTPLHLAASAGHKEIGDVLVQHGSVINIGDNLRYTPLNLVAVKGHLRMVQFLRKCETDIDAHAATIYGRKQTAELLIDHGSDANAGNTFGGTSLHLTAYNKHQNIAEVFLQNGSDVNARDIFGQTPLHLAARSGHQEVTEFVIQQESKLEAQDDSQQTPLHLVARNGHKNIAEVLSCCGSGIYVIDTFRQTPLHSTWSGDQEIRKFLIQQDGLQKIPFHFAAGDGHESESMARDDLQPNADVNVTINHGQLPLHLAAENGHKHIHEILTQHEGDVNARDKFGKTLLQVCIINQNEGLPENFIHNQSVDSLVKSFILQLLSGEKGLLQESAKSRYRVVNQSFEKYVMKRIGCKNGTTCKNGTDKVLICPHIVHKQISYDEYHHFVKAMEVVFLITLAALYICIKLIWEPPLNLLCYRTSVVAECCQPPANTSSASDLPGPVPVTVKTQDGPLLKMADVLFVGEMQDVVKQLVNISQNQGPVTVQDLGSSLQVTHAQALEVLQLLVYTAAQRNDQKFIRMIFSTSAGRLVFNAYKDRPQLPEDVARANGHDDLAQYLQNVNTRLSKESSSDAHPSSIDWLELIEAVNYFQKQFYRTESNTQWYSRIARIFSSSQKGCKEHKFSTV